MAVIKSYTKIKGTILTPEEAKAAQNSLGIGSGDWYGTQFENWSYSNTSNEIVSELQSGASGLTVEENADFYPYITYKSPIIPMYENEQFTGWTQDSWVVDNENTLRLIGNFEPARDFSTETNGMQYVGSNEPYMIFPNISQTTIPNTSKFILQILTTSPHEYDYDISRSGDFGLIDYNDIPEGAYKIYKSVERDLDNVPKYVKIVRTLPTQTEQAYPTLIFVFYDQNSNVITMNVTMIYFIIGGTR